MAAWLDDVLGEERLLLPGHAACAGCGPAVNVRHLLDAVASARPERRIVLVIPASCWTIVAGIWPVNAFDLAVYLTPFASSAAEASGLAAGLRLRGHDDAQIVVWAGDGATADIGFSGVSAAAERGEDLIYVLNDNEAYMNTGVQRSGATPPAARTATTEAVGPAPGNAFGRGKDLPRIAMAHDVPFVATATVADLHDLERKVELAMQFRGPRYLHVLVPCPLGWAAPTDQTVHLARMAQQSGLFPVYEAHNGEVTAVSPIRRRIPVEDYLRAQGRYRHLFVPDTNREVIARIQAIADANVVRYGLEDRS